MSRRHWPVPGSHAATVPSQGPGSFWENRSDRRHCGVDIYAPHGSDVVAVEGGSVLDTGVMTSPGILPYWNTTQYVLIRHGELVARYGELDDVIVAAGDTVDGGDPIGHVGTVLNRDAVTDESPVYIQQLAHRSDISMLHFELYRAPPDESEAYLGGNWFRDRRPDGLIDPTAYLNAASRDI